jgi:4-carboxymuconolactone decarboxylase
MLPHRDKCRDKIQGAEETDMKRRIMLALCAAVGIGLTLMPAEQLRSADKEQRFPLLKLEQLNDQQRPLADEILKVSSIGISGPFNMMLRSPVMGQRMFAMLDYLRFHTSVPPKLNELATISSGRIDLKTASPG